jgi:hypothetical protein
VERGEGEKVEWERRKDNGRKRRGRGRKRGRSE